jgi:hypothetical protein
MVYLYNKTSGEFIGEISKDELQYLVDQLEEESMEDQDYSITRMELEYFSQHSADPELLTLLRNALGDQSELIIQWSRTKRTE